MKTFNLTLATLLLALLLVGCGGTSSKNEDSESSSIQSAIFVDAAVEGMEYHTSSGLNGLTDSQGTFKYKKDDSVSFNIGNITVGDVKKVPDDNIVTPVHLVYGYDIPTNKLSDVATLNDPKVLQILNVLQSLDSDANNSNGIQIASSTSEAFNDNDEIELSNTEYSDSALLAYDSELKSKLDADDDNQLDKNSTDLITHFQDTVTQTYNTSSSTYTLLAWNDLGMHCFDGKDFSVFSILPPYNNLNAQLITKDGTSNKHVTSGVTLTYESYNYNGHINTTSVNKTNFWDYLSSLFPGALSTPDVGLTGNKVPSNIAQEMVYNATHNWFEADGIPIINYDDNNVTNYYPMVKVSAKDSTGLIVATAEVVLPVSDEMNCAKCHASSVASSDAKPRNGWENSLDTLKDYKLNILALHDEKHIISQTDLDTLKGMGYDYNASLYATAKAGTPILCASCHSSNALGTAGVGDAKPLTQALHSRHATVIDPSNGLTLQSSLNRDSCYSCHPGAQTECLRGAMGAAKDSSGNQIMQCQSCHGTMSDIGNSGRTGWLDEPNCQVCHQGGQRYTSALVNGSMRSVMDTRFATTPNTPAAGRSLYRFSTGHGNLQCSSCHGSTHAVYPTSHAQDNMLSEKVQGHSGTVAECTACHTTTPSTTTGGPHGMHSVGQAWVSDHQDVAERDATQCTTCHGSDYRGSVLSKTFSARTFSVEGRSKSFTKGQMTTCYDCHNGPSGD